KVTGRDPRVGGFWNTRGVAHYRAGEWEEAVAALERSIQLDGGDASDYFVLAMAHWQLAVKQPDRKEKAQDSFRRGAEWMSRNKAALEKNEQYAARLRRLQTEAAALIGAKDAPRPKE